MSPSAKAHVPAMAFLVLAVSLAAEPLTPGEARLHPVILEGTLALYPITLPGRRPPAADFLLLDEGLTAGTVVITETGGPEVETQQLWEPSDLETRTEAPVEQVQQREPFQEQVQVQQISGGAQVNRLSLRNDSDRPLLLIAGEMVRGAKQDRIIANDVVIPAGTAVDDLAVFCVESGRWVADSPELRSAKAVSGAAVREAAQLDQSQREVWDKVAKYNAAVGAESPTESLNAAYDKPEVKEHTAAAHGRIEAALARIPEVCGVVVAVGPRIVVADIFTVPELFRRLQEKLLAGYLLDALSAAPSDALPPAEEEVRRYLETVLAAHGDGAPGELTVEPFDTPLARGVRTSWRGDEIHISSY